MTRENRPDPDALLKNIARDEKKSREASLRIFLGMSAGVGKTYAMLNAAQQRMKEGIDVVIGVVVTHGRKETESLVHGLEVLPLKRIDHRGATLEELDIDAILLRKPKLVIIDELAHSNVPGSRHKKRYQDVLEILDAGIDVYTAVNVQHLESRKDTVESITGISIRETVPDSILERAALVELVDIAPTELLKRLKEGKVYIGEKAERASENFFKEDRLTALREIALRITAERVDQDLQRMTSVRTNSSLWQTNERLLVAISHSPYSEKLIRATRRLAYSLESPWIAVHVDTGIVLSDSDQAQLMKNLNLARELNAELITTTEADISAALRRICITRNVTQVVVGRPSQRWFRDVIEGGTLLDRMVRESPEVDVHIIRQDAQPSSLEINNNRPTKARTENKPIQYWYTFCFLCGVSFLSAMIEGYIGYRAIGFVFLLAVLVVGMFGSIGVVVFSAVVSAFVWNFFFIPPRFTFVISAADDIMLCVSFFAVALITGFLASRVRFHEKIIREREERTNFLYETLKDIANSQKKSEFLVKTVERVGSFLGAECGVVLKSKEGLLRFDADTLYTLKLNEKDRAVAQWCFQNQKMAGWSTDTLSESRALYIPLKGQDEEVGVFVFRPFKKFRKLNFDQENLLSSITHQLGSSIEKYFLTKRLQEAERMKVSEELHQTILNSISHEMRTPLTAIIGTAAALDDAKISQDLNYAREVSQTLQVAGDRLNRVVENLLDMSRLNSGSLSLKLEWHDLNDLVGVVVQKNAKNLANHLTKVIGLDEMTLVKIDFRLMEHAVSNLLLNAVAYSPKGSEICIRLRKKMDAVYLEVSDQGQGIPEKWTLKVFDKFYRMPGTPTGGTGLGLSIVKSIVELHKGKVSVQNNSDGGACFVIELPLEQSPSVPVEAI